MEEDFKKVQALLEKHHISSEKNLLRVRNIVSDKIVCHDYAVNIQGQNVHAVFETYVQTGQSFLQNAWVQTLP